MAGGGPRLEFDPATEKLVGDFADEANNLVAEQYATGFELPAIA